MLELTMKGYRTLGWVLKPEVVIEVEPVEQPETCLMERGCLSAPWVEVLVGVG